MDQNSNKDNNSASGKVPDENDDSYQGLTSREEADLQQLMEKCDFTIQDAEAFTERLSREVSIMDTSNIQAIMASEFKVEGLMKILQTAIDETQKLETRVEHYRNLVRNVRDSVFQVEKKEAQAQIQAENTEKLQVELKTLINQLDFARTDEYLLLNSELNTEEGIQSCHNAANALEAALNSNVNPVYEKMTAVVDQRKYLRRMESKVGNRIANHIITVLNCLITEYGEKIAHLVYDPVNEVVLPNHSIIYSNLLAYTELLKWCKKNHRTSFDRVLEQYTIIIKAQYKKSIELFFEVIQTKLSSSKGLTIGSHGETASVANSSGSGSRRMRSSSIPGGSEMADTISSKSSEISLSEWEEFDNWIDRMLSAIDPVCLCEQQFCMEFFDLPGPSNPAQFITPSQQPKSHRRKGSRSSPIKSISPSPSNLSQGSSEIVSDSKKSEELRTLMGELFQSLEAELNKFIGHYNSLDGIYSMYLLVRLTQHVMSAQDTGSFLVKVYGKILILVKRNFDSYMEAQQKAIVEAKIPKRVKCGVFSFISKFESLAKQIELIFRAAGTRRADIDRWYGSLVRSMFDSIDRLSNEHPKTPSEMVRIENYHALHDVLRGLKIPCLEQERNLAKTKYKEAVKEYVQRYFGRPLEKLSAFFEGVQAKVAQGVKEEEVGYQMAYSKTELRKVINDCSLKVVKKGLEEMYRKVEKHAFEPESTLIQVIWRSMQEEFIMQYKVIQEMIHKCYPDANITLNFTVEDVLNVFSEIARSH